MARTSGVPSRLDTESARRAFNVRFVGDALAELRRVTWPTREETIRLSIMVISVAVVVGALLGLIDLAFARVFDQLLGR